MQLNFAIIIVFVHDGDAHKDASHLLQTSNFVWRHKHFLLRM